MKNFKLCSILIIFAANFFNLHAFADEIELKYPELQVSPRASKRLFIEAKKENNNSPNFNIHAPALTASVMTLASAYYLGNNIPDFADAEKVDTAKKMASAGQAIGALWIGLFTYMSYNYKPYLRGYSETKKMSKKTMSDELALERVAEEKFKDAAEVGRKLAFLSTVSNLTISAVMAGYGKGDTALFAGLSALISFAPYYFENYWQTVNNRHQEYKKKIYGPVSMPLLKLDDSGQLISGLQFQFQF